MRNSLTIGSEIDIMKRKRKYPSWVWKPGMAVWLLMYISSQVVKQNYNTSKI
jgi:hypothetical protein